MLWSLCFSTIFENGSQQTIEFPKTTFEIQEVIGSYSKEEIEAVVDKNILSLRRIYLEYLSKESVRYGSNILFKFTIAKNGEITRIDRLYSSTMRVEFDKEIKSEIATWKWNAKNDGAKVTILFKFINRLRD